jgi:Rieske Fe-S protein
MVPRRTFLSQALMLFGLTRLAAAQATNGSGAALNYRPLTRPFTVPLGAISIPWQPVEFEAEFIEAPIVEGQPGAKVPLKGVVFRTSSGDDRPDRFTALSMTCPHQACDVKYVQDPSSLKPQLTAGRTQRLLHCNCHDSMFDAEASGARLGGPAPRGLYRFRFNVADGMVAITDVEVE